MRTKEFLSQLDHDRIVERDQRSGGEDSGEIRVYVQRGELKGDPVVAAQKKFHELGMDATKERNGVLIFVLPARAKFAVIGDEGVHQKCGDGILATSWSRGCATHFQGENFTEPWWKRSKRRADCWREHFPQDGDRNELRQNELPRSETLSSG